MAETTELKLQAFIPYRLSIASNRVSDVIASAYSALFGLTVPQWRVIAVVAEHDGLSQHAIGQRTQMDKVTVSRAAIALTQRRLIERATNPADARSRVVVLSAAGRALYAQVAPQAIAMERAIFAGFTAEERATLMEMLDRIERAAETMDAPPPPA